MSPDRFNAMPHRCRRQEFVRYGGGHGLRKRRRNVTAAAKKPVLSGKPFELGPVKLTCSKHGRSLNHGEHLIEYVLRLQLAVQYLLFIKD
jgi:hypothetical protein